MSNLGVSASITSAAFLVGVVASSPAQAAPASDPKAVAIAEQVMEALGGRQAWDGTRYLRFDFAVEREGKLAVSRAHTWDKWTGRYRLEGKTKEGDPFLVLMNVNTKDGQGYRKGARLQGGEEKKLLEQGYGTWINDTYWLLMPYKMRDPGVVLGLDGEEKSGGAAWDKVVLTFENVGLTPKDKYWAYVNRATHLVDRWDYILEGGPGPAKTFHWKGWKKYGAILLAPDRVNPQDGTRIYFPVLDVPASVPDGAFTAP
jgi:hypothetical protein